MARVLSLAVLGAACLASVSSRGDESVVTVGRQFAASSTVEWEVKDANHPALGPIRFAARKVAAPTAVGGKKFVSQSYVSCQKGGGKIAIELSSAPEDNLSAGLSPKERPTLTCYSPDPKSSGGLAMSEIPAKWEINDLGDAMVSGLSPAALRRCASIDVLQEIALPAGWAQPSQQVVMELLPYSRALDAVFAACGEKSVYAAGEKSPAAAAPWKPAHSVARGQTNVRAEPRVESDLVVKLAPGTKLLVQSTGTDWWKVKPRSGSRYSGYVRKDRLVFE